MDEQSKSFIMRLARSKITKAIDYGINIILVITLVSLLFIRVKTLYYLHIAAFATFIYFVFNPLLRRIIRTANNYPLKLRHILFLCFRLLLFIILFINLYTIIHSNIVLYSRYIIVGLMLLIIIVINEYEKIQIILRDKENEFKSWRIVGRTMVLLFLLYNLSQYNFFAKPNYLEFFPQPEKMSILIEKIHDTKKDAYTSVLNRPRNYISDESIFFRLIDELSSKPSKELLGIELLDFDFKRFNYEYEYIIYFYYENLNNLKESSLQAIYFNETGMAKIIYKNITSRKSILEQYKFEISKDLLEDLIAFATKP